MTTNSKLFTNNNIRKFLKAYHKLYECGDETMFDNCLLEYGKRKTANVLGASGYACKQNRKSVFDDVSLKMIQKAINSNAQLCKLHSIYKISQYEKLGSEDFLTEQTKQIVFNCVVLEKKVNIKKNYSLAEIKSLIEKGYIVLLGVKQENILHNNFFNKNLIEVDGKYISYFADSFLKKHIFPGLKYLGDEDIKKNTRYFDRKFKNLKQARVQIKKDVAKQIVAFELKNEQSELCDNLEKIKNKMTNIANKYKTKASAVQNKISINQNLLVALDSEFAEPEHDFVL